MKAYITGMFFQNAVEFVELAQKAHDDGRINDESRCSIGSHVMCAFTLEGIINEVAEILLTPWVWKKLEKIDTSLKWLVVSRFLAETPFDTGVEPLQTVIDLQKTRNELAHPKAMDLGDETIVRNQDGNVSRNVPHEYVLQNGDTVLVGFGKLIDQFNEPSARKAVKRTNAALRALKQKAPDAPIDWVMELETLYPWLRE